MKRPAPESWEEYRQRMLAETSRFIEWGLRHPEQVIEIPATPAGQRQPPAEAAQWFWMTVLSDSGDSRIRRWRDLLRRRPKTIFSRRGGQRAV